ncbi:hypothetical protein LNKW23_03990 [Paralimibaculum aggregatum]|uniref:Uncharacterized protein n=1 Tax=Paralimibaculum aggregatum TaxID=3036245 RepID=A0ABQ6LHS3_9RHOB|nr:hypothetical protein [Limibaculum sp. NKW23]GMG81187.1 hypothetical protein LNKW23_03990 [Limibaculum sp. NKW23]
MSLSYPFLWLGLAGLAVLVLGLWLKRAQARFVAGLRAAGDPLAEHPGTKPFRQRFQAWLFGLGSEAGGPAPARGALTLAMAAILMAAAAYSLLPELFR